MSLKIVRYGLQSSEKLDTSKSDEKSRKQKEVVPMGSPGGQKFATPRGSILTLSRGSQLPYTENKFLVFVCSFN